MMAKKSTIDKMCGTSERNQSRIVPELPICCVYLQHFVNGVLYRQYEVVYRNKQVYNTGYSDAKVQGIIKDAIRETILKTTSPDYYNADEVMYMRRRSVLVFAVESNNTLTTNGETAFRSEKSNYGYHTFDKKNHFSDTLDNRTFYVSYCLNHMKSTDHGDLWDRESEYFDIDLPYDKSRDGDPEPGTGGTNMGPPIGPP
jgi:hypothetical protein